MGMTLDQIETFLAVADKGSFKAASETLNRSQPALSISVKKLEEELGIQLFDREQYRPSLTSNGRAFYRRCKELYFQAKSLEKYGHQLGMGEEAEITLAIDSLCPLDYITKTLTVFSAEHPDTSLNLSFEVLGGATEKVIKGEAQIALTPQIKTFSGELVHKKVGEVNMIPVISQKVLNTIGPEITARKLKNIPQIIVRDSSSSPQNTNHGILEGSRQWTVKDMATKKELIVSGLGWGRLPEHTILPELSTEQLKEVSIGPVAKEVIEVCLVSSSAHPNGPLSQKLWGYFCQQEFHQK